MVGLPGVPNRHGDGMDAVTFAAAICGAAAVIVALGPGGASRRLSRLTRDPRTGHPRPFTVPDAAGAVPSAWAAGEDAGSERESPDDRRRAAASLAVGLGGALLVGGIAGLVAGCGLAIAAWFRLGRLEPASVVRAREQMVTMTPLAADLLAAALSAGAPPDGAVAAVGEALPGPLGRRLTSVAASLRVGTEPAAAWSALATEPSLRPLARVMTNAARRGTSPVSALERIARDSEDVARWTAEARARAVGARAAVPLGLCFLPAFILVGVVPLIATSLRLLG